MLQLNFVFYLQNKKETTSILLELSQSLQQSLTIYFYKRPTQTSKQLFTQVPQKRTKRTKTTMKRHTYIPFSFVAMTIPTRSIPGTAANFSLRNIVIEKEKSSHLQLPSAINMFTPFWLSHHRKKKTSSNKQQYMRRCVMVVEAFK